MVKTVVITVLEVYLWGILFPRAILSWFPITPGTPLASVVQFLDRLTEPALRPIRRVVPPLRLGGVGLDVAFLILFLGLQVVVIPLVAALL